MLGDRHGGELARCHPEELVARCEAAGDEFDQATVPWRRSMRRRIQPQPLLVPEGYGGSGHVQRNATIGLKLYLRDRQQRLRAD